MDCLQFAITSVIVYIFGCIQLVASNPRGFSQQRFPSRGVSAFGTSSPFGGFPNRNRDGTIKFCDNDNPCGPGEFCVHSCFIPGLKECNQAGQGSMCDPNRPNKAPPPRQNTVIPLVVGNNVPVSKTPFSINFIGAMTLVRTPLGKNILVDTGVISQKIPLINALAQNGLRPPDIDFVMTTHGHPDHYSNINLFPDAQQNFDRFEVAGYNYKSNGLTDTNPINILSDRSLQIIKTPGHTPQDTTLIVSNEQRYGTVAIVGDLFLSEDAAKDPSRASAEQKASMSSVICKVDWIIPGHGPGFSAKTYRSSFGC